MINDLLGLNGEQIMHFLVKRSFRVHFKCSHMFKIANLGVTKSPYHGKSRIP